MSVNRSSPFGLSSLAAPLDCLMAKRSFGSGSGTTPNTTSCFEASSLVVVWCDRSYDPVTANAGRVCRTLHHPAEVASLSPAQFLVPCFDASARAKGSSIADRDRYRNAMRRNARIAKSRVKRCMASRGVAHFSQFPVGSCRLSSR